MTSAKLLWPLLLVIQVLGGSSYNTDTSIFKELQDYKIRICALEIASDKIDSALNTFTKLQDSNYNNHQLQEIINQTYAMDTKNLTQLMRFINKLPLYEHRYAAFAFLSQIVNWHTPESFQFAYQLKKFLDEPQNNDSEVTEKLRFFKSTIPDGITAIIWQESKLCLKNAYFKEYLYSASCCKYDGKRRRAFTWIPPGEFGPYFPFTFEPVKEAAYFWIKNDYFQERLYAAECCQYDNQRRNVFTWIPKEPIGALGEWTLELVNGTNVFRIRNNHYDEYLYAALGYYDKKRRSVFTWKPKGDIGIQGEWEISSC